MTDSQTSATTGDGAEPHPMQALLADTDTPQQTHRKGDVVSGHVVHIGEKEVMIDVGAKFEGVLASREWAEMSDDERAALSVGDEVECMVLRPEQADSSMLLSIAKAKLGQDWEDAEARYASGEPFEAEVSGHNKGGLIIYIGEVRGFVPASQIDRRHAIDRNLIDGSEESPLAALVGERLSVKVIEIDRHNNRLILSEQAAMREQRHAMKSQLLDQLAEGQIVEGTVTSLADFGAFIDIGGADGLAHLSELSWHRIDHPREVLSIGETARVKVISIDHERKRIGLSLKQLTPEPWDDLEERYAPGQLVTATVTRLADFGVFARLEDGIEGLVHVSELSDDEQPAEALVEVGQTLELRVLKVEPERKRIGLSLKRADPAYDALVAATAGETEALDESG